MVMVVEQWVEIDRLKVISFPDFATIMIRRKGGLRSTLPCTWDVRDALGIVIEYVENLLPVEYL